MDRIRVTFFLLSNILQTPLRLLSMAQRTLHCCSLHTKRTDFQHFLFKLCYRYSHEVYYTKRRRCYNDAPSFESELSWISLSNKWFFFYSLHLILYHTHFCNTSPPFGVTNFVWIPLIYSKKRAFNDAHGIIFLHVNSQSCR